MATVAVAENIQAGLYDFDRGVQILKELGGAPANRCANMLQLELIRLRA